MYPQPSDLPKVRGCQRLLTYVPDALVGKTPKVSVGTGQSRSFLDDFCLTPSACKELCLGTALARGSLGHKVAWGKPATLCAGKEMRPRRGV